jgi:hypothetical protein
MEIQERTPAAIINEASRILAADHQAMETLKSVLVNRKVMSRPASRELIRARKMEITFMMSPPSFLFTLRGSASQSLQEGSQTL